MKTAEITKRSGNARSIVSGAPGLGRLTEPIVIKETLILAEYAKIAALARQFAGSENYAVTFAAAFDAKGRRMRCEQHTYDVECVSGRYRGCSGEGNAVNDTLRELVAAMELRYGRVNIAAMEADIRRKRSELELAERLLENERRRFG